MKNVLAYLCNSPWVITQEKMNAIFEIIQKEDALEAVAARLGQPLENTGNRVERRGNVAVIGIEGPIFRYANLFTQISGATSVELLSRDITTALEDPNVEAILLNLDSPGGAVDGISETAGKIYEGRSRKPIWAYVDGEAASGGYWLASAASRIVAEETSRTGSIGVIASISDDRGAQKRRGVIKYDIISSQSPHKRTDPATEDGRSKLQALVDDLADVFIRQVAVHRGTTPEHVMAHYGEGFIMMGSRALQAGMVDEIGTFEGTLTKLEALVAGNAKTYSLAASGGETFTISNIQVLREETVMAEEKQPQAQAAPTQPPVNETEVRAAAKQAERNRINAILGMDEAKGREDLARAMALESDMDPEDARRFLAKAPKQQAAPSAAAPTDQFAEYMRKTGNPKVGVEREETDDVAAEVGRIVAYLPQNQRRRAS